VSSLATEWACSVTTGLGEACAEHPRSHPHAVHVQPVGIWPAQQQHDAVERRSSGCESSSLCYAGAALLVLLVATHFDVQAAGRTRTARAAGTANHPTPSASRTAGATRCDDADG